LSTHETLLKSSYIFLDIPLTDKKLGQKLPLLIDYQAWHLAA